MRRLVHAKGLRYRVDVRPERNLRRRADLVFPRWQVAVFVDGCYWHGCPEHCRLSGRNVDWWQAKIDRNRSRDADTDRKLRDAGWTIIRQWAHVDPHDLANRIVDTVRACADAGAGRALQ